MRNYTLFLFLLISASLFAQRGDQNRQARLPNLAVKSNLLYDATTTFNIGIEVRTGKRYTLDLPFNYNPFTFNDNRKWKHFLFQPELRYWTCEAFTGHFFGIHGHYGNYNAGNLPWPKSLKDYRYRGWLAGAGVSYGYHWMLSNRWSIEASLGVGYAYLDYNKYECYTCGFKLKEDSHHYFGPTKAAISIIYVIK